MELSREDRYEAAVRAVLDLCDEAEDEGTVGGRGMVDPFDIRKAIMNALLTDGEEPT